MKFVGVRQAQAQLSGLVEQSQKERIVLTRHGQPMAILTGVGGKDLEKLLGGTKKRVASGRTTKEQPRTGNGRRRRQ